MDPAAVHTCPHCGAELDPPGAPVCTRCGFSIVSTQSSPVDDRDSDPDAPDGDDPL